jgi:hypothetical protein
MVCRSECGAPHGAWHPPVEGGSHLSRQGKAQFPRDLNQSGLPSPVPAGYFPAVRDNNAWKHLGKVSGNCAGIVYGRLAKPGDLATDRRTGRSDLRNAAVSPCRCGDSSKAFFVTEETRRLSSPSRFWQRRIRWWAASPLPFASLTKRDRAEDTPRSR